MAAARPIGSLIKPVLYLMALEQHAHLATPLRDVAVSLDLPGGQVWQPRNFDETEHGRVPLVRGLADSLNLATVNLGLELGIDTFAQRLTELSGQPTKNRYPSLLLGAEARTPLAVQQLYATFASGGFAMQPRSVVTVVDELGQPLTHYPIALEPKIDPAANANLTRALIAVMEHGTGKSSRFARRGVAGKTGTSDDYRDSWFAGFDASHLAVVWIGRDDNQPAGLTGAKGALQLWDAIMRDADLQPLLVPDPPGSLQTLFDYQTGYAVNGPCAAAEVISEPLPANTALEPYPGCARPGWRELTDRVQRWLQGAGQGDAQQ